MQKRIRRGAVSAEVYKEEDAAQYVKKVIHRSLLVICFLDPRPKKGIFLEF